MKRGARGVRRAQRRRGALVAVLSVGALAVTVSTVWVARIPFKVRFYEQRILEGRNPQGNLNAIAMIDSPAAVACLEKYVLDPLPSLQVDQPLRLLCRHHPESRFARGVREWESILGRPYFGGFAFYHLERREPLSPEKARKLRDWLDAYPIHPARDDAFLLLAFSIQESSPIEALQLLHEGFHAPDGDKHTLIANYFQRVLERFASADQLTGWLEAGAPDHLADNLLYAAALKKMRSHDFKAAVDLFDRSVNARGKHCLEMRGDWPGRRLLYPRSVRWKREFEENGKRWPGAGPDPVKAIDAQIEACRWFLSQKEDLERAQDDESRAATLHAMARRCFREADLFSNHVYYEILRKNRPKKGAPFSLQDVHLGNHYRQAAEFFRQIVAECPSYSQIAEVEYSIPLCLWRLRRAWPVSLGAILDREISRLFQAFAERYPKSSMADEGLYLAGIHHWLASGKGDESRIRTNMLRIVDDYPDGNVVRDYRQQCGWLNEAIRSRVREE